MCIKVETKFTIRTIEQLRRLKFIDQSTLKLPEEIQLLIKTTESPLM